MQALLDAIATMAMPTDAQRIFHGRGGLYPGCEAWTLDAFPPVWLITKFGEATPTEQTALTTGQQNHQLNGITSGAKFLAHDLFSTWGKVNRMGPYGLVIADPPSYQKGSFVATKDYARLIRRLPDLLRPGGHALLCLNAPEIPEQFLRDLLATEAPELEVLQRLPNPSVFADVSSDRALKVLMARLPPLA